MTELERVKTENAELKRQLEERRINLTINTHNHCEGVGLESLKTMAKSNNFTLVGKE